MSHSFPSYPHVTEKPSLPAWQVFLLLVFFCHHRSWAQLPDLLGRQESGR